MSMYVDILSSSLDDWASALGGSDLIEYAVLCREELHVVSPSGAGSAYTALAAEIAYDRALIALCTERGIDAHATSFTYPRAERQRIETVLAHDGVDLDAPRQSTRTKMPPEVDADGSVDVHDQASTLAESEHAPPHASKDAQGKPAAAFVEASEASMAEPRCQ